MGRAVMAVTSAMLVMACGAVPTPTPAVPPSPSVPAVPVATTTVPTATLSSSPGPSGAAAQGSISVLGCPATPPPIGVCLGAEAPTVAASAASGGTLRLTLTVHNGGTTASTPVSVLLRVANGTLPFGPPVCTSCSTSSTQHAFGLEWPALAPGETRLLAAELPITAPAGKAGFQADLYAESLVDLITSTTVDGFRPGDQAWTVSVTVKG